MINDPMFHKAQTIAKSLADDVHNGEVKIECLQFFETQWDLFVKKMSNKLKGDFYNHVDSPLIYLNDREFIGNGDDFAEWALLNYKISSNEPVALWNSMA